MEYAYPLVFLAALAYASVGHGGASGYLAITALLGFAPAQMAPSALILNILVSGLAFIVYRRAGHYDPALLWPFALASVPAAFAGGLLTVPRGAYSGLLVAALLFAALRLALSRPQDSVRLPAAIPMRIALPIGAVIGLLSGIVGVGGGIFLSPILILMGWADAKRTAAASAGFILVNSLAGLYGHASRNPVDAAGLLPLVMAAFSGGLIGSYLGANRFGDVLLRRALAMVLIVAATKLFMLRFS